MEKEDPWQFLAACIEFANALRSGNPEDYVSHLPIHQDGTCNGLQHYSALGRDTLGILLFLFSTISSALTKFDRREERQCAPV